MKLHLLLGQLQGNSGPDFVIEFLPVIIQGIPRCLEHEALAWEEEEVLLSYDLAPSDRRYVEFRQEVFLDRRSASVDPDHA